MPWKTYKDGQQWCIHKLNGDGTKGARVDGGCHDTESEAERHRRALEANVNEMVSGQFTDVMAITELRGSYPNVPIAPDVDYAALIAGDDDPMFLTLPIAEVDSVSINKRYYDEAWVQELERQTLANKPIGLMGHLSERERATAFPDEAIHWVGVARHGKQSWGKGYVPPGPVRDRIRRYKAQGKAMATSIDAFAEGVWQEARKAYRMDPKTLKLGQIDIAPADRAGIPSLAAVPHVTREMPSGDAKAIQDNEHVSEQEQEMTKEQLLQELAKATVPPQRGWSPPANGNSDSGDKGEMERIRELLGVDAKADLVAAVTELRQAEAQRQKDAVTNRITELVGDKENGVKLDKMRGMVTMLVAAEQPQTPEEAEQAYKRVREMEEVKAALGELVQETMGPPQRTPLQPQHGKQNKYFQIPEKGAE